MIFEIFIYIAAAFFEILGCYSFWMFFKLQQNSLWLFVGIVSLAIFAYLLTKVNLEFAGRAYAVYGGIYIVSSLFWLYFVEKQSFNKWDLIGGAVCILGASIILIANQK